MIQYIAAFILRFIKPGYYKQPLFEQMCRLNTLVSVEVVCSTEKKILLKKRNDKHFGDVWHIPGTMVRGNEAIDIALKRLLESEIPSGKYEIKKDVDHGYFQKTPRGNIFHLVFRLRPKSRSIIKMMYEKDSLPENTLGYHRRLIEENYS